jgi:hypothetical protein
LGQEFFDIFGADYSDGVRFFEVAGGFGEGFAGGKADGNGDAEAFFDCFFDVPANFGVGFAIETAKSFEVDITFVDTGFFDVGRKFLDDVD